MTTKTWLSISIVLAGSVGILGGCTGTRDSGADDTSAATEPSDEDAYYAGFDDARESNPSCSVCDYEDHWNVEAYETDELRNCYVDGYNRAYDVYCLEACKGEEGKPYDCCLEALDFVSEQVHALGLYGMDTCVIN